MDVKTSILLVLNAPLTDRYLNGEEFLHIVPKNWLRRRGIFVPGWLVTVWVSSLHVHSKVVLICILIVAFLSPSCGPGEMTNTTGEQKWPKEPSLNYCYFLPNGTAGICQPWSCHSRSSAYYKGLGCFVWKTYVKHIPNVRQMHKRRHGNHHKCAASHTLANILRPSKCRISFMSHRKCKGCITPGKGPPVYPWI